METIILKINSKNKTAKALMDLIIVMSSKPNSGVELVEEKSPYNPEFVKMIKKSSASKKRYRIDNVESLWESL